MIMSRLHKPRSSTQSNTLKPSKKGKVSEKLLTYDPKISWEYTLSQMKTEFEQRWHQKMPSPETGLDGFEEVAVLGKGAFGKVILVQEEGTDNVCACKILEKDHIVKKKQVHHVHNEKRVLSCIEFPNLIRLLYSTKDNDRLYMFLPFLIGGELFTYHRLVRRFQEPEARFYAAQVFLGLEYLHNLHVLYRDIKPENICFEANGYIVITDFGFAKRVETRTATLCGTPEYLAPEVIQTQPYGTSADWWAFGILIYEFVAGYSPFSRHNRDVMLMYEKIINEEYEIPNFFSNPLKHLIFNLLQADITKRFGNLQAGDKDIKSHEWFKDINWFSILNQKTKAPHIPSVSGKKDISYFERYPISNISFKSKTCKHEEVFMDF